MRAARAEELFEPLSADRETPDESEQEEEPSATGGRREDRETPPRGGAGLRWSRLILSLVLGLGVGVAAVFILNPRIEEEVGQAVTATSAPGFLVLAVAVMMVSLVADAWSLVILARVIRPKASWLTVGATSFEANLVGGATSFGGLEIPYQIVVLRTVGLTSSQSTSIVIVKGLVHTTILVLAAGIALVPIAGSPITPLERWILLAVFGFLFVVWTLGTLWLRSPLGLSRLPVFIRKRVVPMVEALDSFRTMGWRCMAKVSGLQVIFWAGMFSLIPLILLALGYRGRLVPIAIGQAVLQVIMPFSPLPGGAGVAEVGYLELIGPSVPDNIRVASLIIWRALSWLLPMALGGLALGLRGGRWGRRRRRSRRPPPR